MQGTPVAFWHRVLIAVAVACVGPFFNVLAHADPPPPGVAWLDVGGIEPLPLAQPRAYLEPLSDEPERRYLEVLGEAAFQAPEIFGTLARRSGLSCQACHINGTVNPNLLIDGLSARPGGLDVTSSLFNTAADDSVFNRDALAHLQKHFLHVIVWGLSRDRDIVRMGFLQSASSHTVKPRFCPELLQGPHATVPHSTP